MARNWPIRFAERETHQDEHQGDPRAAADTEWNHHREAERQEQTIRMVADSATKTSFLSASSADPATIRICIKVSSQAHKCGLRWLAHYVPLSANPGKERLHGRIDGDRFNTWGYNLLGQNRPKDAHAVFKLAVWAHPTSANAQDSLADGTLQSAARKARGKL
jgi:hypothetical protein